MIPIANSVVNCRGLAGLYTTLRLCADSCNEYINEYKVAILWECYLDSSAYVYMGKIALRHA